MPGQKAQRIYKILNINKPTDYKILILKSGLKVEPRSYADRKTTNVKYISNQASHFIYIAS